MIGSFASGNSARMNRIRSFALIGSVALSACGTPASVAASEELERADDAVTALDRSRQALQWLGILPSYECGEDERFFVGRLVESLNAEAGCVAVADEPDDAHDRATVSFGEGCVVRGRRLSGELAIVVSGGDDRKRVELDLSSVAVDGESIPVQVSYGTCGDEDQYAARVSGTLSQSPKRTFALDLTVASQEGVVLIGDNTLVLKGHGELVHPEGADRVSFDSLSYEMGDVLPKDGEVLVETSKEKHVRVRFEEKFWRLGLAEVKVNDDEPVVIPVIH